MINNLSFDSRFPLEFSIVSFENTNEMQFESYCRASYYQLIWIKEGFAEFEIDMKSVRLDAGHYLFIGKDMVYKFDASRNYKGYIVSFTDFYYCRSERDILFIQNARIFKTCPSQIPLKIAGSGPELELINVEYLLKRFNEKEDPLRDDVLHTLLKLFLYRSEASLPGKSPSAVLDTNQVYVRDFKHLVNEHFIEHKELSFYTEQLGISSKQLLLATKQVLGKNAKEVIIEKIIIEAKRFLTYSGLSVKQIAYCIGFNEPNNFSIFFNKYAGMTPGKFKKQILDKNNQIK